MWIFFLDLRERLPSDEVRLFQRGRQRFLVGQVAFHRLDGAVNQHRGIVSLEGIGAGYAVVGGLVAGDELFALRIVEIGCPVCASKHADRRVLLGRQRRFIDRECGQNRNLLGKPRLTVLLHEADAHAARHERKQSVRLERGNL